MNNKSTLKKIIMIFLVLGLILLFFQEKRRQTNSLSPLILNREPIAPVPVSKQELGLSPNPSPWLPTSVPKNENKLSDEPCWQKVIQQYQINTSSFIEKYSKNLFAVVGPWYFSKKNIEPTIEHSISGQFFLALARAGLLDGKKIKKNSSEAIDLLHQLILVDPQNSAPRIYLALIKNKLGKKDEVDELIKSLKTETTYFNTYVTVVAKTIFKYAESPEEWLAASELWSTSSIPNVLELKSFLIEHQMTNVTEQMLSSGISNKLIYPDFNWVPLEYAVGKSVMDKINPQNTYPKASEHNNKIWKTLDQQLEIILPSGECNLNILNEKIKQLQDFL